MENINELPKYEGAENLREGVDFIDVSEKSEKKLFKNKVEVLMSKLKSAKEKALKDKKRAATATASKAANTNKPTAISPLSLSDEEFAKMIDPRLM